MARCEKRKRRDRLSCLFCGLFPDVTAVFFVAMQFFFSEFLSTEQNQVGLLALLAGRHDKWTAMWRTDMTSRQQCLENGFPKSLQRIFRTIFCRFFHCMARNIVHTLFLLFLFIAFTCASWGLAFRSLRIKGPVTRKCNELNICTCGTNCPESISKKTTLIVLQGLFTLLASICGVVYWKYGHHNDNNNSVDQDHESLLHRGDHMQQYRWSWLVRIMIVLITGASVFLVSYTVSDATSCNETLYICS